MVCALSACWKDVKAVTLKNLTNEILLWLVVVATAWNPSPRSGKHGRKSFVDETEQ